MPQSQTIDMREDSHYRKVKLEKQLLKFDRKKKCFHMRSGLRVGTGLLSSKLGGTYITQLGGREEIGNDDAHCPPKRKSRMLTS